MPFRRGYQLYALVPPEARGSDKKSLRSFQQHFPFSDFPETFDSKWVEVELDGNPDKSVRFASSLVDLSAADRRTDRPEWVHIHHQRLRQTRSATFEFSLHWTVATGNCMAELAHGWARKATQCGFSLIPVPGQ